MRNNSVFNMVFTKVGWLIRSLTIVIGVIFAGPSWAEVPSATPTFAEEDISVSDDAPIIVPKSITKGDSYNKNKRQRAQKPPSDTITTETLQSNPITEISPEQKPVVSVPMPDGVTSAALPDVSLESIGSVDAQNTLGTNIWKKTAHGLAIRLVAGLPTDIHLSFIRNLQRRLLLGAAEPPQIDQSMELADQSLLTARLNKLWNTGFWQDYRELVKLMPPSQIPPNVTKNLFASELQDAKFSDACAHFNQNMQNNADELFWRRARIFCALVSGKNDVARLQRDLMAEKSKSESSDWLALTDAALGGSKKTSVKAKNLDVLDWALVRFASIAVNTDEFDGTSNPGINAIIIGIDQMPALKKIELAEKMALRGIISPEKLLKAYQSVIQNAPVQIQSADNSKLPAAMRRANNAVYIQNLSEPAKKTAVIADLFQSSNKPAERRLLALAVASSLTETLPVQELQSFAPTAIRLHAVLGNYPAARLWMDVAVLDDAVAVKSWPYVRLLRLVDGSNARGKNLFQQWITATLAADPKSLEDKLALLALAAKSLGDSDEIYDLTALPKNFNADILALRDSRSASAASSIMMQQAVQNNMRGAGLAMVIYALGGGELADVDAHTVVRSLDAVQRLLGAGEARNLALEVLANAGL